MVINIEKCTNGNHAIVGCCDGHKCKYWSQIFYIVVTEQLQNKAVGETSCNFKVLAAVFPVILSSLT